MNPIVDAMSNRNKGHIIMDGDGKTAFPDCESSGRMRAYLDETNDDTRDWGVLGYWGGPHLTGRSGLLAARPLNVLGRSRPWQHV